MVGRVTEDNIFRVRLNELFTAAGRPLTNRVVANGVAAHGCRISTPYLSQLRTGMRGIPSDAVVAALAKYFGVAYEYFFTVPCVEDPEFEYLEDGEVLAGLSDPGLRELLLTANRLSAVSLDLLADMAVNLRAVEARHIVPADSPSYVRVVEAQLRRRRR